MKLHFILFLLLPFFTIQAEEIDYSKIETLINTNASELEKEDIGVIVPEDKKPIFDIAEQIKNGECPANVEKRLMPHVIKRLLINRLPLDKSETLFDCIKSTDFNSADNYNLMVDLLPFWNDENPAIETFYATFFVDYKKTNPSILGLLDIAKLMCAKDAISYFEKNDYPTNYDKTMSPKEYSIFEDYIKNFRCEGYS